MNRKPVAKKPEQVRRFILNPASAKRVKESFDRAKKAPVGCALDFVEIK